MLQTARRSALAGFGLLFALAAPALAQWSTDPANNLRLADAPGGKDLSKLVPTADGGFYVSWLDAGRTTVKADTWRWSGTAWTKFNVGQAAPPARAWHSMANHAGVGRVVMFGGFDGSNVLGDTWLFDNESWTAGPAGPAARQRAAMGYDPSRQRVVLFGGANGDGSFRNDTWTFNGSAWAQENLDTIPPARRGAAMAWCQQLDGLVMFGGEGSTGPLSDTWLWTGTQWMNLIVVNPPTGRYGHSMAFDAATGMIVMHGGDSGGGPIQETWTFDGTGWTLHTPANNPAGRSEAAMAEGFVSGGPSRALLFGGFSGTFNLGNFYEWNGVGTPNWTTKATGPSNRRGSAMAYDATRQQTVLFGGQETGGYDVMLQRLNAAGVEQWPHGGVMVADRSVSSTIEYTLTMDAGGNAIVVFADDRFQTGKVTAQKVDPAGVPQWNGVWGVQVGEGSTTGTPPKAGLLSSGEIAVAWNTTTSPTATNMARISAAGVVTGPFVQVDTLSPVRPLQASDIVSDGAGGWITLFVRCNGTNCATSAKHLYAQRYNSAGVAQWAGGPVPIFTGTGSLQVGAFPRLIPDGASPGGAIVAWNDVNGTRQAYLQHVLSDGTMKFTPALTSADAEAGRARLSAAADYDVATGEYFLATTNSPMSPSVADSVAAQKFDAAGVRQWGTMGMVVASTGTNVPSLLSCVSIGGGSCVVGWLESRPPTAHVAVAARVESAGTVAWTTTFSSNQISKGRLYGERSTAGYTAFSFTEGETILAQNLNDDGTLGPPSGPTACNAADIASAGNPDPDAGPDGFLTGDDFDLFINAFFNELRRTSDNSLIADLVDGDGNLPADGFLTGSDFDYFLGKFFQGC